MVVVLVVLGCDAWAVALASGPLSEWRVIDLPRILVMPSGQVKRAFAGFGVAFGLRSVPSAVVGRRAGLEVRCVVWRFVLWGGVLWGPLVGVISVRVRLGAGFSLVCGRLGVMVGVVVPGFGWWWAGVSGMVWWGDVSLGVCWFPACARAMGK